MILDKNALYFSKMLTKCIHSNVSFLQLRYIFEAKIIEILHFERVFFFKLSIIEIFSLVEIYTKTLIFQSKLCIFYFDGINISLLHSKHKKNGISEQFY